VTLDSSLISNILQITNQHWKSHIRDRTFEELVSGKEPGHHIADYVDDRTTSLLKVKIDTRYEADSKGNIKKRSMGDVWIHSNGIYNPVNIKSGLLGMNGQPNVVSMQKLLDYLLKQWIDSYYLLIIKFEIGKPIKHKAVLVDLLEWLDFISYDAGPGQIMLRENLFYEAMEADRKPKILSIAEKINRLFERFEEGVSSLITNRKQRLDRQRELVKNFSQDTFVVDQSKMRFTP